MSEPSPRDCSGGMTAYPRGSQSRGRCLPCAFASSSRLGCQQAERGDPLNRLGTRPAVELGERAPDVHLDGARADEQLSLIHISEPTRLGMISYAVFCL